MYIDLSVELNQETPVYPGDAPVKVEPAGKIERDGFNDHVVSVNTHVGTHVDAPLHMIADGKTLDLIPVDQFVGRGVLITVNKAFDIEFLKQADIRAGDIVLFRTDMSEHYNDPVYFEQYPAMSVKMAQYLVGQKVKMVGVDTGSIDNADGFPVHKALLAGDVLIIENLTNLDKLIDKEFKVYALPIKLTLDGAPARVIAEISED